MKTVKSYDSPDHTLRLLVVRAEDGDVSLGFDGCSWHTHADVLAATYCLSEEQAIERFIKDAISNRTALAVLKHDGAISDIWITDNAEREVQNVQDGETVEIRYWASSKRK